ncbi:hypothetical protein, partial [Alkalibaculum sporogenes]|uniref:hypothetical protein n=1 Tax=Alkalibaculum sporogenes TaxID=2655001 RepID=UPI001A9BFDC7
SEIDEGSEYVSLRGHSPNVCKQTFIPLQRQPNTLRLFLFLFIVLSRLLADAWLIVFAIIKKHPLGCIIIY